MKSIYHLYILAVVLFFLPLSHALGDVFHGTPTWNKLPWILVPLIASSLAFKNIVHKYFFIVFLLLGISFFSIDELFLSFFEWLRLAMIIMALPSLWFIFSFVSWKKIVLSVVAVATLHAQWGLFQFTLQRDIALYIVGESRLSTSLPGVAKFATDAGKYIRPYGPYAHSNTLAGIMVMGLLLSAILLSQFNSTQRKVLLPVSALLFLTLLTTFSRASYISALLLFIPLATVALPGRRRQVFQRLVLLFLLMCLVLLPLITARVTDKEDVGIQERMSGLGLAIEMLPTTDWWHGFGPGQYSAYLEKYLMSEKIPYKDWQVVPVHNVPLLIISEWGLLPTLVFIFLCIFFFKKYNPPVDMGTLWWFAPFLPLFLFDHYLLTQSAPLFWLLLTGRAILMARTPAKIK